MQRKLQFMPVRAIHAPQGAIHGAFSPQSRLISCVPTESIGGVFEIGSAMGRMYPAPTGSDDNAFDIESATGEHVGSLLRRWLDVAQAANGCTALFQIHGRSPYLHHLFPIRPPLRPKISVCGSTEASVFCPWPLSLGSPTKALFVYFSTKYFSLGTENSRFLTKNKNCLDFY